MDTWLYPTGLRFPSLKGMDPGRILASSAPRAGCRCGKGLSGPPKVEWLEVYAGGKSYQLFDTWLPDETLAAFRQYRVGIKGPLTTRWAAVFDRSMLPCVKKLEPVCLPAPCALVPGCAFRRAQPGTRRYGHFPPRIRRCLCRHRIEAGSAANAKLRKFLLDNFPTEFNASASPILSHLASSPSLPKAPSVWCEPHQWALDHQRRSVTLVHKGNIMKFTEGAFPPVGL